MSIYDEKMNSEQQQSDRQNVPESVGKDGSAISPTPTRTPYRSPSSVPSSYSMNPNSVLTSRSSQDQERSLDVDLEKQSTKSVHQDLQATACPAVPFALTPSVSSSPGATYPEGGREAWLVVLGSFSGMFAVVRILSFLF